MSFLNGTINVHVLLYCMHAWGQVLPVSQVPHHLHVFKHTVLVIPGNVVNTACMWSISLLVFSCLAESQWQLFHCCHVFWASSWSQLGHRPPLPHKSFMWSPQRTPPALSPATLWMSTLRMPHGTLCPIPRSTSSLETTCSVSDSPSVACLT